MPRPGGGDQGGWFEPKLIAGTLQLPFCDGRILRILCEGTSRANDYQTRRYKQCFRDSVSLRSMPQLADHSRAGERRGCIDRLGSGQAAPRNCFSERHEDHRAALPLNIMSFRLNFASTTVSCISNRNMISLSPG